MPIPLLGPDPAPVMRELAARLSPDQWELVLQNKGIWLQGAQASQPCPFASEGELRQWLQSFCWRQGKLLSPHQPECGGRWAEEGIEYRWQAVWPPIARAGALFILRRMNLQDPAQLSFSRESIAVDWVRLVNASTLLLIAGPTGSGKTSLLAKLLTQYHRNRRVVLLEDTEELPNLSPSWLAIALADEQRARALCLRLTPDVLAIGELRTPGAARLALDLAATGHGCVMTTIHAGSVAEARQRFQGLCGDLNSSLPVRAANIVLMARGQPPRIAAVDAVTSDQKSFSQSF